VFIDIVAHQQIGDAYMTTAIGQRCIACPVLPCSSMPFHFEANKPNRTSCIGKLIELVLHAPARLCGQKYNRSTQQQLVSLH
jgi:hypothetical protein